jgi:hypothetical protein
MDWTVVSRQSGVVSRSLQSQSEVRVDSPSPKVVSPSRQSGEPERALERCDCRLGLPTETEDCDSRRPTADCRLSESHNHVYPRTARCSGMYMEIVYAPRRFPL